MTEIYQGIQVIEHGNKFKVPHLDSTLTFIYPLIGPDSYDNVRAQILEDSLLLPTMAQTASLVYTAWRNPAEEYSRRIINLLKSNSLWTFNKITYSPNSGSYIYEDLENKKDIQVGFVPFGYKVGEQSPKQLERNPFVLVLAGEEGAEKLAEISTNYKFKPYLSSFNNVAFDTKLVAALGSDWVGGRLYVLGARGDGVGCAFGVSEVA